MKTVGFKSPKYVGDPINAVKIFNEKESDELIVLDIDATAEGVEPDYKTISQIAAECRMPLCYGGGVKTARQAKAVISLGVEKVAISAAAVERPELIAEIADAVGRQSVVVIIDAKKRFLGNKYDVWTHNGRQNSQRDVLDFAEQAASLGAGEIVLNSIDLDGKMVGYDLDLARRLSQHVMTPISIIGGAGSLEHMRDLFTACGVIGAVAGSLFVFKGNLRAVLINYPDARQKEALFANL